MAQLTLNFTSEPAIDAVVERYGDEIDAYEQIARTDLAMPLTVELVKALRTYRAEAIAGIRAAWSAATPN